MSVQIGICYSRIRADEKLLLSELRERGHDVVKIDVRELELAIGEAPEILADLDLVVDRCLATSRSVYVTQFLSAYGVPVVNAPETATVCADKVRTSLALDGAGVPTPATTVAFTTDSALSAIESFGYPCVLKPVVGSWGRLMAKIDSRSAAEAILEHKSTLGHYEHKVFYVQEFVDKPGRDLRVLAVDGEPIAGMVRSSDHWITNAAAGAETTALEIDDEIAAVVAAASDAVGGGLLGIDLMEIDDGYTVHEVNHTVEFKALNEAVDVDVPAAVVDWLEETADSAANTQLEVTA
ncbi:Lysine biosynthesis enzyme LysX [Halovivax ruber XH-70]|uniref:Lysine biosynthesis enzyme LysX n=1 Tax=Halovivax ruber (strain DSM 18193 / JCM 13892 / XH-70) TaxID=797302 RepID=L0IAQ6_HALRX|nr:lysine biosynthesis protein LysX [Halovivax ruber]AGB15042.1 Lysine biosynthesis enzyme LysX [Halovivax ruber XH-70]